MSTINQLEKRARMCIEDESRKPNPDNMLIDVLCDTVRLCREYGDTPLR